ncbi:UDP-N-acetylglucosamine 2-epimerase [Marinobacter halotolerans]|uniref:UDP-N-acetylglucosamine 2-epimerase n=1 Tax=Marinobacter halotolerans TaxID=1569211 RepID=UPI001245DAE0|nr:UDP-N-acetylglucosamine 2-epimerase [Marinobacter halotolerans]
MIHVFLGTKAQLIKMAPIMKMLQDQGVSYNFIHSGQHQETMNDILNDFSLPEPDSYVTTGSDIKEKIQVPKWAYLCEKRTRRSSECWAGRAKGSKDIVLVHGDTFSTLIGALAAKRMGFKCGHIESGLRSFNLFHPFPEELVRLSTFRLADIFYCPDDASVANLKGYDKKIVHTHGNTMLDATKLAARMASKSARSDFGIVSIHRYENIFRSARLEWIVDQVIQISRKQKILFIMHPPTEHRLRNAGLFKRLQAEQGIELRKRLSYFEFTGILAQAQFLVTDGGSNQEESSYIGLPCLVMRKSTERQEGIGRNVVLSNYSEERIRGFFDNLERYRSAPSNSHISPAKIIVDDLKPFY